MATVFTYLLDNNDNVILPKTRAGGVYVADSTTITVDQRLTELQSSINSINTNIGTINSGKAPTNHASSATTYGVGTTSVYGHVKVTASNGLSISNGTISMGLGSTSAAGALKVTASNGLVVSNGTISMTIASPSASGVMTNGTQSFAGTKTFSGTVYVGNPSVGTMAARNIRAQTGDPGAGSALTTGQVLLVYE